jgi:hypothetical protein
MVKESEELVLYGSLGCHLCEQAEELLVSLRINFLKVEITDDEALMQAYGIHIPVLKQESSGKELFWPFDTEKVLNLFNS